MRKNMPNKWWRRQKRKLKHIRINGHFLLASKNTERRSNIKLFPPKKRAIYTVRHRKTQKLLDLSDKEVAIIFEATESMRN